MLEQLLNEFFITSDYIRKNVKMSKEYEEINKYEGKLYDKLEKVLEGEQLELFQKFVNMTIDRIAEENASYFAAGLKAGFRITVDLLNG